MQLFSLIALTCFSSLAAAKMFMSPTDLDFPVRELGGAHGGSDDDCNQSHLEEYDWPLHIGAIFIILGVSFIGTILPVLGKSNVRFRVPDYVFMVLKAYGMGIILSTGYIHMFPPANKNLTSKCLPREWNEGFTAYAGLFALMATLSTQLIQTIAINHFKKRRDGKREEEKVPIASDQHHHHRHKDVETDTAESISTEPAHGHPGHHECNHDHHTHAPGGPITVPEGHRSMESSRTVELGAMTVATNIHSDGCCDVDHVFSASDHDHLKITAVILEAGIALHSLIIGITLGVTSGHEFVSLLIAVAFHQFFEGFALSVTALEAGFQKKTTPVLMALVYTLTTPVGVAIGVGISESYNGNAVETLLLQGIFDAISAGILIYDALVNLITVNITHSQWFSNLSLGRKGGVFLALWLGAGSMALLGRWA